jgi:hypothetical protein
VGLVGRGQDGQGRLVLVGGGPGSAPHGCNECGGALLALAYWKSASCSIPRKTDITRKDATDSVARRRPSRPTYKPGPADLGISDVRPLHLWYFESDGPKTVEAEDVWCKGFPVHNSLGLWFRSRTCLSRFNLIQAKMRHLRLRGAAKQHNPIG